MSERVIVVGAGIGGLAAAIRLVVAGLAVTLVEAQATPGGRMRCLPSVAGPVDAGPTVLTMRHVFDDLFAAAGARLEDHVTLLAQPLLARHWWPDGAQLDLYPDAEANAAAIRAFAGPRAEADFRRFQARAAALYQAFDAPVMRAPRPQPGGIIRAALARPLLWPLLAPGMTLARAMAWQFRDPRLRQLFGRYATYVGGSPYRVPAVLALIWQAEQQGVWAVQGGMHRLALALAALAQAKGVRVLYGSAVERIARQGGRVSGVVLVDGTPLAGDRVVFNGDPAALTGGLLGSAPQAAVPRRATAPRSLSAWVWAFAARPSGLPLVHHNLFFTDDPRAEFDPIAAGRMPEAPTLYLCAEDRSTCAPPSGTAPERFEIIMNGPPGAPPPPEEFETCHHRSFHRLARFGLQFDPEPGPGALTTPAEFGRLFPATQGAIYGRSPEGTLATFLRPGARTALPGLYLAGGGVHPGAGVPMAALSGRHAAEAILSDLALASTSGRTAMPGGMSMASRMTGRARSR